MWTPPVRFPWGAEVTHASHSSSGLAVPGPRSLSPTDVPSPLICSAFRLQLWKGSRYNCAPMLYTSAVVTVLMEPECQSQNGLHNPLNQPLLWKIGKRRPRKVKWPCSESHCLRVAKTEGELKQYDAQLHFSFHWPLAGGPHGPKPL